MVRKPAARVALIHWKAEEAEPRLQALRAAGYEAVLSIPNGSSGLKYLAAEAPAAVVIDLSRLPSQGAAVGVELRARKATREVPLVFAGGLPEKVARTRQLLPHAVYTEWDGIAAAVANALRHPQGPATVPNSLAVYKDRPLVAKLGIREGAAVGLLNAPPRFEYQLDPLPEGVKLTQRPRGADRVLLFCESLDDLAQSFDAAAAGLCAGGGLWILWPKRRKGLTMPLIRAFAIDAGWVDYKVCAVDERWSGMLLARRSL